MMASRLMPLRFVGFVFICSFSAVILAIPIDSPRRYSYFDSMIAFWSNNSCVFPPVTTFQRDALTTDSLVLEPCISGEQDDRAQTENFTGQLCSTLYSVSKAFCTKAVSQSAIAQDKVNPYVEDERWDVCKDAQTTGKNILSFMTRDRALCEQNCLSSATLGPVCRLLVAGVVSYMRSTGQWKASENRSVIATQGRTQTDTEKGTSNTDVIPKPESRANFSQRDHPNGARSGVDEPGPTTSKTQEDTHNREGPVSGVKEPGPMGDETEKDFGDGKRPVVVNQPRLLEDQTEKVTGNGDGSINEVNHPDYTQEYGDELKPEASSRATQPVEQSTVEGITNVSSSQRGTVKVPSKVDVAMSQTNPKADDAQKKNAGEVGSDKYHSIETNKEENFRGGTVREGTDNHTKASEPKNKDAAESKEEATDSSARPFKPVEDSDYPSFDEDEDENPDTIDKEYENPKFDDDDDDENDNRDFEISSDTKKAKQQPDIPKDGVVKIPKQMDAFEEEESSGHFMAYFVTAVVLCIAGYVLYHNKQKIIAFVLEGRRDAQRRRTTSSGTAKYTKLQPSVEEVMPSLDKSAATKNFIY